jgi:aldose 1-epimerase
MDTEITLSYENWSARVSSYGASLRGAWFQGEEVVTSYSGKENKVGGQGDVLIPFPGRIKDAKYTWDGVEYNLKANDKDGPNAIHGFLRTLEWEIESQTESEITFSLNFPGTEGYPFVFSAQITYLLNETGMACSFSVQNGDSVDIPMAAGFHAYFTTGSEQIDSDMLKLPFQSVLEMESFIPTSKILDSPEFLSSKIIGDTKFNSCFLSPILSKNNQTEVQLTGNEKVITVWMDEAFPYVVLYSGDPLPESHRRKSLAIEPMTCGSDGFNHPDWGLFRLAPGQALSGRWGVCVALVQ